MPRAILLLAGLIVLTAPPRVFCQTADSREIFASGYALYSSGKGTEAKELFRKTLSSNFRLADYSLYYLAAIAYQESDFDQARQRLQQLKERFPESIWSRPGTLLQVKIDVAKKNYSQAAEVLRQLRADKSLKSEIADEALYLQGQIREAQGEPRRAYALYDELRNGSRTGRWTAAARKAQAQLRERYPDLFGFYTMQSLADEADRLARERQITEAEILYKKLLNNAPDPENRLRFLTKLSGLYLGARKRAEALPLLEQIPRDYPETSEAAQSLYQIGQIFWNRHDNATALEYFEQLLVEYPKSAYADRAQYAAADIHEYFGRREQAAQLYANIAKDFPLSTVREEASWRLAWLYYRAGELAQAADAFKALAKQAKNGTFGIAAVYWHGRSMEKLEDVESAKRLYRQVVSDGTESYYQELGVAALQRLGEPATQPAPSKPTPPAQPEVTVPPSLDFHLARARELGAASLHALAVAELDEVNAKATGPIRTLVLRDYFRNHAYRRSLTLATQVTLSQAERDFYRYPLAFWELIQQKARDREIDPYLVVALIRQESLFDTRARSPAAALGLMQLIPPTAARVARQLGLSVPAPENLFEAELNLTLGTQYLKDLLQRYSNNWHKALAAYNAGEAAVDRWEREIITDDVEEFVERIPYVETRGYVKLVLRNHRIYKRLYDLTR